MLVFAGPSCATVGVVRKVGGVDAGDRGPSCG